MSVPGSAQKIHSSCCSPTTAQRFACGIIKLIENGTQGLLAEGLIFDWRKQEQVLMRLQCQAVPSTQHSQSNHPLLSTHFAPRHAGPKGACSSPHGVTAPLASLLSVTLRYQNEECWSKEQHALNLALVLLLDRLIATECSCQHNPNLAGLFRWVMARPDNAAKPTLSTQGIGIFPLEQ